MKGIILAGGSGTRLYPLTSVISKQLLPVYDKPMIYYPLSTLMLAKIREVLIISTPNDIDNFKKLLKDGSDLGMKIEYRVQEKPEGIAQAFIIGEDFIKDDDVCLILGDNIFYGNEFSKILLSAKENKNRATIFGQFVKDPERFGVLEFDKEEKVISIEEKPENPKSNYAIVGLYFYDNRVVSYAKNLKPSARNELEITDLNKIYLENNELDCRIFGRGFAWLDTGEVEALASATNFVKTLEEIQGIKIAVIEEIAFRNGWISLEKIQEASLKYKNSSYGKYLEKVWKGEYHSKI